MLNLARTLAAVAYPNFQGIECYRSDRYLLAAGNLISFSTSTGLPLS